MRTYRIWSNWLPDFNQSIELPWLIVASIWSDAFWLVNSCFWWTLLLHSTDLMFKICWLWPSLGCGCLCRKTLETPKLDTFTIAQTSTMLLLASGNDLTAESVSDTVSAKTEPHIRRKGQISCTAFGLHQIVQVYGSHEYTQSVYGCWQKWFMSSISWPSCETYVHDFIYSISEWNTHRHIKVKAVAWQKPWRGYTRWNTWLDYDIERPLRVGGKRPLEKTFM